MTDFSLFDALPNGVILFKDKKIEYLNQHILDVLSIGYFSKENSIEIILKILDIKNEEDLLDFFTSHNSFSTQNKLIQLEHTFHEDYVLISLTRINESLITKELCNIAKENPTQDVYMDEEIAKCFKANDIHEVKVMTFYKGVPLKNIANVIRVNSDSIEIKVDSKHRISLLERDDILVIINTQNKKTVLHGEIVNSDGNLFTVKKLYPTNSDMHLRSGLRVKPDNDMMVSVKDKEFKVYDISANGISLYINEEDEDKYLRSQKSITLTIDGKVLQLSTKYIKTISDKEKFLKIIFTMTVMGNNGNVLQEYIINKQNQVLREIHEYQKNN